MPRKPVSWNPGKVSATAGTSGVARARVRLVIASGRSWWLCRYWFDAVVSMNRQWISPEIRSAIALAIARYGTPCSSIPARRPRYSGGARRSVEIAEHQFARGGLGGGDKAREIAPGRLRPHHQIAAAGTEHADHGKIPGRIIAEVTNEADIRRMRRGGDQQHCVAVGLGGLHRHRADDAIGARTVVDDDSLPGLLLDLLADRARGDVTRTARPERHDDLDRPRGILRGLRLSWRQRSRDQREDRTTIDCCIRHETRHEASLLFLVRRGALSLNRGTQKSEPVGTGPLPSDGMSS